MSGTQRLPGGQRRKASQRPSRPAAPLQPVISRLWHPGDRVRWRDRIGVFRRDVGDSEHAEIVIEDRTYRVRVGTLHEGLEDYLAYAIPSSMGVRRRIPSAVKRPLDS